MTRTIGEETESDFEKGMERRKSNCHAARRRFERIDKRLIYKDNLPERK
jgi:hypothetical protein